VDASVIFTVVSVNTNTAAIMIAEKGAALIRGARRAPRTQKPGPPRGAGRSFPDASRCPLPTLRPDRFQNGRFPAQRLHRPPLHAGAATIKPQRPTASNPGAGGGIPLSTRPCPTRLRPEHRNPEACAQVRRLHSGTGGTRTHGRRIMSPLRILAVHDLRLSMTFCLVRAGQSCRHPRVFVGLFLSLRPERVPNEPGMDELKGLWADPASSGRGLEPARSGLAFQHGSCRLRWPGHLRASYR